ncbi:MAG: hypothetical protein ACREKL_03810 [Chthoniobacterales bacterium]
MTELTGTYGGLKFVTGGEAFRQAVSAYLKGEFGKGRKPAPAPRKGKTAPRAARKK